MVIKIMYVCVGAVANLGHHASHATQIFIFSRASHNLPVSNTVDKTKCSAFVNLLKTKFCQDVIPVTSEPIKLCWVHVELSYQSSWVNNAKLLSLLGNRSLRQYGQCWKNIGIVKRFLLTCVFREHVTSAVCIGKNDRRIVMDEGKKAPRAIRGSRPWTHNNTLATI